MVGGFFDPTFLKAMCPRTLGGRARLEKAMPPVIGKENRW
jgi:hypothetical protein